ncbi:MAG: 50S ribosomal protein L10 [Actinomycetota bacterium]
MPNAEKIARVEALKGRIESSEALLLTEYRGLTVHDATELRRSLSDHARFTVVKNTLMQRAAGEAGIEELKALLEGPTAVAFVSGDVVSVAKKVVDASKKYPALVLKGAYMEGKVLGPSEAQALATLDSRDVMLSKIAGMLKSEMTRAASMLQALQGRFLGVLEAYREKLPPDEAPAPEPSASEAVAPEAAAPETATQEGAVEVASEETGPGETQEAPMAETGPKAETAEPAESEAAAEEPEGPSEEAVDESVDEPVDQSVDEPGNEPGNEPGTEEE